MELRVGNWVFSYHPGIWQIYRILTCKVRSPVSGLGQETTTVFSKRFLSETFKRSFKEECCSPDFVEKLDDETMSKLERFIKENAALYKKFNDYVPKPIDEIYNARIGTPKGKGVKEIEALISKDRLFNGLEINPYLEELGFHTKELPSWTAQFVSEDHQCKDGYLAYKFHRILEH